MIEVRNLTKHYGDKIAVNDISFTVEDGEILGFLGPNGAGKSTTMNMLTGYISSTSASFKGIQAACRTGSGIDRQSAGSGTGRTNSRS